MENTQSTSDEIIKIDTSCLNGVNNEVDAESTFQYFNTHFIIPLVLLVIVFLVQLYFWLPDWESHDLSNFTYRFSNYWDWWNHYGVFTSMFLHGWFWHLFSNLIFLYPFTLITSSILKSHIYVSIILITGIIAGESSYIFNDMPSLWASGWIFGIFGFLTPYYLYNKNKLSSNVQDIPWVFLFMSLYMIYQGLLDPNIDNVAHIVWFISGILYGFIYFRYYFSDSLNNSHQYN